MTLGDTKIDVSALRTFVGCHWDILKGMKKGKYFVFPIPDNEPDVVREMYFAFLEQFCAGESLVLTERLRQHANLNNPKRRPSELEHRLKNIRNKIYAAVTWKKSQRELIY